VHTQIIFCWVKFYFLTQTACFVSLPKTYGQLSILLGTVQAWAKFGLLRNQIVLALNFVK
jgi:hypothetical protein